MSHVPTELGGCDVRRASCILICPVVFHGAVLIRVCVAWYGWIGVGWRMVLQTRKRKTCEFESCKKPKSINGGDRTLDLERVKLTS